MYHSAIDPDGINLAMGWDTNLDGVVDIEPHKASLCCTSQSRWNAVDTDNNSHMVSIAFHATGDVVLLDLQTEFLLDHGG